MIAALFALAAAMIIGGCAAVIQGFPYVRLESGLAMVIAGSVAAALWACFARSWLRHARRGVDGNGRVVDEDLETFLARNARYAKWKVTGVSLFEARRPADGTSTAVRSP